MDAVAEPIAELTPARRRFGVTPAVELGTLVVAIGIAIGTYLLISGRDSPERLLTPPLVALLLVANLLAFGSLIVLLGRRVAKHRAAHSPAGGEGQLHVRLVAIFSTLASVPTVLLAVIASLLFQYGAEFWFSPRTRAMIDNSQQLAKESYTQMMSYVDNENVAMANDLRRMLLEYRLEPDSSQFTTTFVQDVYQRSLSNAVLFSVAPNGEIRTIAIVKNSDRNPMQDIEYSDIRKLQGTSQSVVGTNAQRTYSLTRVLGTDLFLYATREMGAKEMAARMDRARAVLTDYGTLLSRTRSLQIRFNIALLVISLIVIGVVVVIAITVADRLVRPLNELVGAARQVSGGDLSVRVPVAKSRDEVAALGSTFNIMTARLEAQNNALVSANAQIESRRALIEAVMSGVSAGVISTAGDRTVRLMNASALALLRRSDEDPVGRPLAEIAPELDALLDGGDREAVVQLMIKGEARTLAVKLTADEGGKVLTFDDITQQLLDQRRAAWSDVARRIAHEIKNPLTPIQLAAERLQRRYGKQIDANDGVFARLTDTIVRQVGDLRRMVDEFSSFARMPKPMFRRESLLDIARQAMFLHEVAHPTIRFEFNAPDPAPSLICDRRQIGQALTNVIKNAVEAIEARGEGEAFPQGEVVLNIEPECEHRLILTVEDNGVGLPVERDRIVEPYMTTRSRGTGLGLAIVKKIIEEHFGTIGFGDRPGGGTLVTVCFDTQALDDLATDTNDQDSSDPRPAALTRTGSTS